MLRRAPRPEAVSAMNTPLRLRLSLGMALVLLADPARAVDPTATDAAATGEIGTEEIGAEEIAECVRGNLPHRSSVQTIWFRSTDRVGSTTASQSVIHWQRFDDGLSRVMLRFHRPLDLKGAGILLLEKKDRRPDTLLYLPALQKVRRVTTGFVSTSMFGTDFSYEDFERLMGMSRDTTVERLDDASVSGRPVYVLAGTPDDVSGSAYERVVSYVDQERCVPLRVESFEPGGGLRKVLEVDPSTVEHHGAFWVPRTQTLRDLRDGTATELELEEIELDVKIHRKMFSERELQVGAR